MVVNCMTTHVVQSGGLVQRIFSRLRNKDRINSFDVGPKIGKKTKLTNLIVNRFYFQPLATKPRTPVPTQPNSTQLDSNSTVELVVYLGSTMHFHNPNPDSSYIRILSP